MKHLLNVKEFPDLSFDHFYAIKNKNVYRKNICYTSCAGTDQLCPSFAQGREGGRCHPSVQGYQ